MPWQVVLAQNLGAQNEQQDVAGAWTSPDQSQRLIVLADGAGGHRGGRQAAETAVATAEAAWRTDAPGKTNASDFLERLGRSAHDAVAAVNASARSTWLALIVGETWAAWAHSGDTRLYHYVAGRRIFQTADHSLVQVLVEKGTVSAAEARHHADRSTLLQSLGGADYREMESGEAELSRGDVLLLCTDGVWAACDDSALDEALSGALMDPQCVANHLVAEAVRNGGAHADNASLIIVGSA